MTAPRGPAVDSWNSVTANQIEAFQTADQRAEMMSQPIRFVHVFLWIVGSNPAHAGLKLFIKQNCTLAFLDFKKQIIMNK